MARNPKQSVSEQKPEPMRVAVQITRTYREPVRAYPVMKAPEIKRAAVASPEQPAKAAPMASHAGILIPAPEMRARTEELRRKLAIEEVANRAGYKIRELSSTRDGKPLYAVEILSAAMIDEVERFFDDLTAPSPRPDQCFEIITKGGNRMMMLPTRLPPELEVEPGVFVQSKYATAAQWRSARLHYGGLIKEYRDAIDRMVEAADELRVAAGAALLPALEAMIAKWGRAVRSPADGRAPG